MTIFAGCYDLNPQAAGEAGTPREQLRRLMCHAGAEDCMERVRGRLYVTWFDGGAYPDPGLWEDHNSICLLAGDPVYTPAPRARNAQAAALAAVPDNPAGALAQCAGTYSMLLHRVLDERLVLATDTLGSRPLYYAEHGGRLYFSSCLSVLEGLSVLPLTVSADALFERLSLTINLDGRTPYRGVRVLRQGEHLTARANEYATSFYHRWDGLPPVELDYPGRVRRVYELFRQAVERRCWRSQDAIAMLSGGLDSRMNAGVLHQLGRRIVAVNCAPPGAGLHDETYAGRVAAALGCGLVRVPLPPGPVNWGRLTGEGIRKVPFALDPAAARLVFSGDGGSVGLGLVYYQPETIALLRDGRFAEALEQYLKPCLRIPNRYLQRGTQTLVDARLRETIRTLTLACDSEPGRQFHLFLMHNDQRTHLHSYYEQIARHEHEILTPFYDADLLRFALACPVDDFAGHRLYHDVLAYLPEALTRIPWQTYPGHLPCPVAEAGQDGSQFSTEGRRRLKAVLDAGSRAPLGLALNAAFPSPPFRRLPVLASSAAALIGWDRFAYIHRAVEAAAHFLTAAQGRFHWDLEPPR